jgi:hypothetical protein
MINNIAAIDAAVDGEGHAAARRTAARRTAAMRTAAMRTAAPRGASQRIAGGMECADTVERTTAVLIGSACRFESASAPLNSS